MPVYGLDDNIIFPDPELASEDGLLAVGGDLSLERLNLAYDHGIFPWFNEEDPLLWWSPPTRAVIYLNDLKVSKSLKQNIRNGNFEVTFNQDFKSVIEQCKHSRADKEGTWITEDIINSYYNLHKSGRAHSVEVTYHGELVGGLYGVVTGAVFCGESMFSLRSNASKVALYYLRERLQQHDFKLIDCQIMNPHLERLGAIEIDRKKFLSILRANTNRNSLPLN